MSNKYKTFSNLLTNEVYGIPEALDDKQNIDSFLANHQGKNVVVVQGLGFVGAVMALVCANAFDDDYAVIGVDLATPSNYWKIKSLNEGVFPVVASDPKIEEFHKKSHAKGNFYATYDSYAYSRADVVIVDINLDVDKKSDFEKNLTDYDVNLEPFKKAMHAIGKTCSEEVLILVETTVPPGTCQKVVKPIIDQCLKERGLSTENYKLGHSYERVMPGSEYIDSIQNFYRVFSGINEASADAVEKFLRTIISTEKYPLTRLGNTNATEMAKVLENSFRAMNIAFMVEWSRFAEEAGVNIYEVVNAIRMRPTHKNIMFPGIGVGGYCLTKDSLLASWSKQALFGSEEGLIQSETGVKINDQMPLFAYQFLKKNLVTDLKGKRILILGVSYRSNVADTRYTPVEPFYDYLIKDGAEITLHDPYVDFWEEKDLQVSNDLQQQVDQSYNIIAICTSHHEYMKNEWLIESLMSRFEKLLILDTVGVLNEKEIDILKEKHTLKILGRGDV